MVVHRFMSAEEWRRLQAGQLLVNESKHRGFRSESRGFCFTTDDPKEAIHYLSGNVDTDVCVTMEVPEGMLRKTKAIYRDHKSDKEIDLLPTSLNEVPHITKTEYCCTRYSLAKVKVIASTTEFSMVPDIKETAAMMRALGYKRNR